MIFQHTHEWVMNGTKTQTRRIIRPGEDLLNGVVYTSEWRKVYEVGKSYAVQPGRGKKAIGRIKITNIRSQDVRDISDEDIAAEGFRSDHHYTAQYRFLHTWVLMHDSRVSDFYTFPKYFYDFQQFLTRPDERYQAWVIEFELMEATP